VEIGLAKFKDFKELVTSIHGEDVVYSDPSRLEFTFRYAPSIILRSEVETFNGSTPRFAIRASIQDKQTGHLLGIVNLRRLLTFASQRIEWAADALITEKHKLDMADHGWEPADSLWQASPVADSFFEVPSKFQNDFHVIKMPWDKITGEWDKDQDDGKELWGTPFMNHIPLAGGGLCAQACAFMCAALLYRHAKQIHGLAEITMLARDNPNELRISGLGVNGLAKYFKEIGLRAEAQQVQHYDPRGGKVPDGLSPFAFREQQVFSRALKAYVQSDMPVILAMDLRRMCGDWSAGGSPLTGEQLSIYNINKRRLRRSLWDQIHPAKHCPAKPEDGSEAKRAPHAVVLLGCTKPAWHPNPEPQGPRREPDISEDIFVIHDPASSPFLTAPLRLINDSMQVLKVNVPRQAPLPDDFVYHLAKNVCTPVTPERVRARLLDVDERDGQGARFRSNGLFSRVSKYRLPVIRESLGGEMGTPTFEHLRLLPVAKLMEAGHEDVAFTRQQGCFTTVLPWILQKFNWDKDHWVWCNIDSATLDDAKIWIWDAEQAFPFVRPGGAVARQRLGLQESFDVRRGFLRLVIDRQKKAACYFEAESPDMLVRVPIGRLYPEQEPVAEDPPAAAEPGPSPAPVAEQPSVLSASCITSISIHGSKNAVEHLRSLEPKDNRVPIELYICMQAEVESWFSDKFNIAKNHQRRSRRSANRSRIPLPLRLCERFWVGNLLNTRRFYRGFHFVMQITPWNLWMTRSKLRRFCAHLHQMRKDAAAPSALEVMSVPTAPDHMKESVRQIRDHMGAGKERQIIGFATYLPEISAELERGAVGHQAEAEAEKKKANNKAKIKITDLHKWERAERALCTVVRMAGEVRKAENREVFVVELVAGNVLGGLERRFEKPAQTPLPHPPPPPKVSYVAKLTDPRKARHILLQRLEHVAEVADQEDVYLALEMEPGPLSVLGGLEAVLDIATLLDSPTYRDTALSRRLGFNLDVGHWAFLEPNHWSMLLEPTYLPVFHRILHAHISDHCSGHFADNELAIINKEEAFRPWLELLALRANVMDAKLPFSKCVSLELEACKSTGIVQRSVKTLRGWLK